MKSGILKRRSGRFAAFQVATNDVNFPEAGEVESLSDIEADATGYERLFTVGHDHGHMGMVTYFLL